MGNRLENKVAVVTGAGRGLGRSHALALAAEGAKIVVNDIGVATDGSRTNETPAEEVVAEIRANGGEAVTSIDSVTSAEGAKNIIDTAVRHFGKLDILVNNAGILMKEKKIYNVEIETIEKMMAVHLLGHFFCCKYACQRFKDQNRGGRIINSSSEAGLGNVGQSVYGAAKEGIIGLTRSVARDMGKLGVTCNAIRPRASTRMLLTPELKAYIEAQAKSDKAAAEAYWESLTKFKEEDVSAFVVFLCLDVASNINGCTFGVWTGNIHLYSEPEPIKKITSPGGWELDYLIENLPPLMTRDLVNPAPAG